MRLPTVLACRVALFSTLVTLATLAAAAPTVPVPIPVPEGNVEGEYWEMTNKMSMNGMTMPMPGGGKRVCQPKNAPDDQLAKGDNKDCKITSQRHVGNRYLWEMSCTGKEPFTGTGEMERLGPDAFRGKMTMNSSQGAMTMDMEGHKVGGACDPYENVKKTNEEIKKVNAAMAKNEAESCRKIGTDFGDPATAPLYGSDLGCQTRNKAPYCEGVKTSASKMTDRSFFGSHAQDQGWRGAFALCGLNADEPLKKNCATALADKDVPFLNQFCPAEGQQLADRMCVGDDVSLWRSQGIAELCEKYSAHAREVIETARKRQEQSRQASPGDQQPPQPQNPLDKLRKGAKGLGGLFGIPTP